MTRIGLRTHGCVESRWIPPKGRFVSLEAKDESWAKYFRLGRSEEKLMELYDVRTLNNKLIGYSKHDPAKCQHLSGMRIPVLEGRDATKFSLDRSDFVRRGSLKTIDVSTQIVCVDRERFVCWYVRIEDAESLARSDWLKCIGEDRLEEFVWELRQKRCEHAYWNAAIPHGLLIKEPASAKG